MGHGQLPANWGAGLLAARNACAVRVLCDAVRCRAMLCEHAGCMSAKLAGVQRLWTGLESEPTAVCIAPACCTVLHNIVHNTGAPCLHCSRSSVSLFPRGAQLAHPQAVACQKTQRCANAVD